MNWDAAQTVSPLPMNDLEGGAFASLGVITAEESTDVAVSLSVNAPSFGEYHTLNLFIRTSLDGVTWSTGPVAGFKTAELGRMVQLGAVPFGAADSGPIKTGVFSIRQVLGWLPPFIELVAHNASPDKLGGTGHQVFVRTQA